MDRVILLLMLDHGTDADTTGIEMNGRMSDCESSTQRIPSDAASRGEIEWLFMGRGFSYNDFMKYFTAIIHRGEPDEGGFWATCLEMPGANGQGETREECLSSLQQAVQLLLQTEREEAFRLDPDAETAELVVA
jgi:predicted RNase H-like HicB family nuclease